MGDVHAVNGDHLASSLPFRGFRGKNGLDLGWALLLPKGRSK